MSAPVSVSPTPPTVPDVVPGPLPSFVRDLFNGRAVLCVSDPFPSRSRRWTVVHMARVHPTEPTRFVFVGGRRRGS